jgi:hypothetical protein
VTLTARWAAPGLAGVIVLLVAGAVVTAAFAHLPPDGSVVLVFAFPAVGAVVARKQPRNPIGWCLLGAGLFLAVTDLATAYSILDYRDHAGHLLLGPVAVLLQPSWAPAIFLFALALVLFPDGTLPSGRWRWPVGLTLSVGAVWLGGAFVIAADAIARGSIHVDSAGNLVQTDHPTGSWAWWGDVQNVWFVLLAIVTFAWIVSRIPEYRSATAERRQQLKCLLAGAGFAVLAGIVTIAFSSSSGILGVVGRMAVVGLVGIPAGIGIGILRYRLYDIDRLISRTLSYTLLTAALVAIFAGLVLLSTRVLPFGSPVGVAASTLAVAALFNPVRARLQRLVDRRFNRARYDADALIAAFAARVRQAAELEDVQHGLLDTTRAAVAPSHLSLWLRR